MPKYGRVRVRAHTRSYPRRRNQNLGCPVMVLVLAFVVGVAYSVARMI